MPTYAANILSQGQFPNAVSSSHNPLLWGQWAVTATTTSNDYVWNNWASATTSTINYYQQRGFGQQQGSALGQSQAAAAQQQFNAASQRPVATADPAASDRAKALMRDNLTAVQREALDKHGWFLVEGGKSGKLYRVRANSYAGNIYELDDAKKEIARYCVHARDDIPLYDHLLAQALSLRYDEDHIIGRANRTALRVAA